MLGFFKGKSKDNIIYSPCKLEGCGGKENIASIDNCITRLRLEVKDITLVNDKVIKSAGVAGVMKPGKTSVQVIIGTKVQFVADAFSKLCE